VIPGCTLGCVLRPYAHSASSGFLNPAPVPNLPHIAAIMPSWRASRGAASHMRSCPVSPAIVLDAVKIAIQHGTPDVEPALVGRLAEATLGGAS